MAHSDKTLKKSSPLMAPDMKEPRFGRIEKASQKNEQYYKRNVRNFLGAHLINSLNTPNFAYPAPERSWVLFVCFFFAHLAPSFRRRFLWGRWKLHRRVEDWRSDTVATNSTQSSRNCRSFYSKILASFNP